MAAPHDIAPLTILGRSFTENLGQLGSREVRFYSIGDPLSVALTPSAVIFSMSRTTKTDNGDIGGAGAFRIDFEGCNPVEPVGLGAMRHATSYFHGRDPAKWVIGASSFTGVLYEGLYPGVDLRFRFSEGALKYDLFIGPGADASLIRLRYSGVDRIVVDDATGDLLICTAFGTFRDSCPQVVQEGTTPASGLPAQFLIIDRTSIGFELPRGLDRSRAMVIDPGITLCTYLGGAGDDLTVSAVFDALGNVYVCGRTNSTDFPATPGAFDQTYHSSWGLPDSYITKLDPSCSEILAATFVGGAGADVICTMDISNGELLAVGETNSSDFPVAGSPLYGTPLGSADCFILRIDLDLTTLAYCGFYGGSNYDSPTNLAIEADGSIVISGVTNSSDLPTTPGALATDYKGRKDGSDAIFVCRLDSALSGTEMCTYINYISKMAFGGFFLDMSLDRSGDIHVVGTTNNFRFPSTPGSFDSEPPWEPQAFVLRLAASDGHLMASTFLGGSRTENGLGIAVSDIDLIYVTGITGSDSSTGFPITPNALQKDTGGWGNGDAFLTVFAHNLSQVVYSTILGERFTDEGVNIAFSPDGGRVYVSLMAASGELPTTKGCYDVKSRARQGRQTQYLLGLNTIDYSLAYASYMGICGLGSTSTFNPIVDPDGHLLFLGDTDADRFPLTDGALDTTHNGSLDGYVIEVDPMPCPVPEAARNLTAVPGKGSVLLEWQPPVYAGCMVSPYKVWRSSENETVPTLVSSVDWPALNFTDDTVTNGVEYRYRVQAVNSAGEGPLSDEAVARPLGFPSAPIDLRAVTGNGRVNLTWTPPIDNGGEIFGYIVTRSGLQGVTETVLEGEMPCLFMDSNVSIGAHYEYTVFAFNSRFNGTEGRVNITALGPPPHFEVTPGDGMAVLNWSIPPEKVGPLLQGIRVYRGRSSGLISILTDVQMANRTFMDTELENGYEYVYYITTLTADGESGPSPVIRVIPFGRPFAPLLPYAEAGDRQVLLTWIQPEGNGRAVLGYNIYFGDAEGPLKLLTSMNATGYLHPGLTNGVTYFYEVTAITEGGESVRSSTCQATPMGPPGEPTGLSAASTVNGVMLSWGPPVDWGGASSLYYRVLRGVSLDTMDALFDVRDGVEYLDETAEFGVVYFYGLQAVGFRGGPLATISYARLAVPGPVTGFTVTAGEGNVVLNWSAPATDGGSAVTGYIVLRGRSLGDLVELVRVGEEDRAYNDTNVQSGTSYVYCIRALNAVGQGPMVGPMSATPLEPPGPVMVTIQLQVQARTDAYILVWSVNEVPPASRPTAFVVLRGTSLGTITNLTELGAVYNFTDGDVSLDRKYYYQIVALHGLARVGESNIVEVVHPSPEPTSGDSTPLLLLGLVILVCVILTSLAMRMRRPAPEGGTGVGAEVVVEVPADGAPGAASGLNKYIVEEVFVVFRDGRMIADCAREAKGTMDADIMSSMLIAVQGIIQDGLQRGSLESIRYGDSTVMMVPGKNITLAAVVYGQPDDRLREELNSAIGRIESTYAGVIERWIGDLSILSGVKDLVMPIVDGTRDVRREEVGGLAATRTVSVLSAVDFHRGYVRLKVAAVNSTEEALVDASIGVDYNPDMLRLERVEPVTLSQKAGRTLIGNVKPGEKVTAAFLFDPQMCQSTHLEGDLAYYDAGGALHRTEMKRRTVDVVCPVFFTRQHANTAMLRQLVKERLHSSDTRLLRFPKGIGARRMLELGKAAMGMETVQLVREYIEEGPPLYAESWYYGETKVKGYQMVMRLGLIEESRTMELFVASTDMEPVTGLLAEFRRDLERGMRGSGIEGPLLEPEMDGTVRERLLNRGLRIVDDVASDGDEG